MDYNQLFLFQGPLPPTTDLNQGNHFTVYTDVGLGWQSRKHYLPNFSKQSRLIIIIYSTYRAHSIKQRKMPFKGAGSQSKESRI